MPRSRAALVFAGVALCACAGSTQPATAFNSAPRLELRADGWRLMDVVEPHPAFWFTLRPTNWPADRPPPPVGIGCSGADGRVTLFDEGAGDPAGTRVEVEAPVSHPFGKAWLVAPGFDAAGRLEVSGAAERRLRVGDVFIVSAAELSRCPVDRIGQHEARAVVRSIASDTATLQQVSGSARGRSPVLLLFAGTSFTTRAPVRVVVEGRSADRHASRDDLRAVQRIADRIGAANLVVEAVEGASDLERLSGEPTGAGSPVLGVTVRRSRETAVVTPIGSALHPLAAQDPVRLPAGSSPELVAAVALSTALRQRGDLAAGWSALSESRAEGSTAGIARQRQVASQLLTDLHLTGEAVRTLAIGEPDDASTRRRAERLIQANAPSLALELLRPSAGSDLEASRLSARALASLGRADDAFELLLAQRDAGESGQVSLPARIELAGLLSALQPELAVVLYEEIASAPGCSAAERLGYLEQALGARIASLQRSGLRDRVSAYLDAVRQLPPGASRARAALHAAELMRLTGAGNASRVQMAAACEELEATSDLEALVRCRAERAEVECGDGGDRGDAGRAAMLCVPAANALLEVAQRAGDSSAEARAQIHLAAVSERLGDLGSMRRGLEAARSLAEASADPGAILDAWTASLSAEQRASDTAATERLATELAQWERALLPPALR